MNNFKNLRHVHFGEEDVNALGLLDVVVYIHETLGDSDELLYEISSLQKAEYLPIESVTNFQDNWNFEFEEELQQMPTENHINIILKISNTTGRLYIDSWRILDVRKDDKTYFIH